jgi:hypothetical protein
MKPSDYPKMRLSRGVGVILRISDGFIGVFSINKRRCIGGRPKQVFDARTMATEGIKIFANELE